MVSKETFGVGCLSFVGLSSLFLSGVSFRIYRWNTNIKKALLLGD